MKEQNKLPDTIIIGAMKCGTTSLWHHLQQHPEISIPSHIKNIEFFDSNANWGKGLDFYSSHFTHTAKTRSICEISTEYTKHPHVNNVAENIYNTLPNAKFIYLIRHPIERLISHYIHNVGAVRETRGINNALHERENNPYIIYSQYYYQLNHFLKYFDKDRFLLITSNQLRENRQTTLNKIFDFINVDHSKTDWPEVNLHEGKSKKSWNRTGRLIRKSPKYFNLYSYYLSRIPISARPLIERLVCQPITIPAISDDNLKFISNVFSNDLALLHKHTGFHMPDWTFPTGTDKPHA